MGNPRGMRVVRDATRGQTVYIKARVLRPMDGSGAVRVKEFDVQYWDGDVSEVDADGLYRPTLATKEA